MSALLCALAALWLAAAVHLLRDPCGPVAPIPALVLGLGAAAVRGRGPQTLAQIVLGAGLVGTVAMHLIFPPAELPFARLAGYRAFAAVGLVLALAYLLLRLPAKLQRARFLLLVLCFVVLALAAAPSWAWVAEAVELAAAALILGSGCGVTAQLAAGLLLFGAALGSPYGAIGGGVLLVWSAALRAQRGAPWRAMAAPLAGAAWCAAGLLSPGSVCDVPALGVGLFCAAAAVEGWS